MHDSISVNIPSSDDQLESSTLQHIICDLQAKDPSLPYPSAPSPVESDFPFYSAGSSTHSSMSPSICDNTEEPALSHLQSSSTSQSYPLEIRRPNLTPLAIEHSIRYASPWSAVDGSVAYTDLRRGSLPSIKADHSFNNSRPVTAPLSHIYQPSWSDQDDTSRFAYSAYSSSVDDLSLSSLSSFHPAGAIPQSSDVFFGTSDDPLRSRPSTREEYPAYIPDCQETIHVNPSQTYTVDPSVISASTVSDPSQDSKPTRDAPSQQSIPEQDSFGVTTSPTSQRRSPARGKSKGSPIIETYKNGVVPSIKRRGKLPKSTTELLKTWLYDHAQHPYPTEEEKRQLCSLTGLTFNQVSNWMINARRRILPTRNNSCAVMAKPVSPRGNRSSGEQYRQPEQMPNMSATNRTNSPSSWNPSISIHVPVPSTYYTTPVHLEHYATSDADPTRQPCVPSSDFYPAYGLSAGGNPFNYHGSIDGNILSRSLIDSNQYIQQAVPSLVEQGHTIKRER